MTKNGIFHDIENSNYYVELNDFTFYFSSMLHLNKFLKLYKENRDILSYSLSKRFKIKINAFILSDIMTYKKVESRGFFIRYNGRLITCPEKLNGAIKISLN